MADSAPRGLLYVISCLRIGGGERQLVEHLREIDRARWRPLVACFERVGELLPPLLALGVDPFEFPLKGDLEQPNTAWQALRMARLVRREHIEIIHGYDFWGNLLAIAAARLAGRPVVVNQLDQGKHLSRLQRGGQKVARRLASRVVTNASALASEIVAEGTPKTKVRVVPQGLDLPRFDALTAREPEPALRPWTGPTVVVVANMQGPQKGHEDLIDAASRVPGVRFLLCGDGRHRPVLEARARDRGVADRVTFLGKRADVPAILARSSALCHPSHAEGLPNAVIEALAARRPVVATSVGGVPELVEPGWTGLLAPPGRPEALAGALRELLANPVRARAMGEAGRRSVERDYTVRRMAERHDALYEELLACA
jgi:glycosyltransferase involved in cell wall biosynthesis